MNAERDTTVPITTVIVEYSHCKHCGHNIMRSIGDETGFWKPSWYGDWRHENANDGKRECPNYDAQSPPPKE